jgi:glycosyltransferase involved in cell wall biosynthesis
MNTNVPPVTLSVIIPVYQGAMTIAPLVDLLVESLQSKFTLEIILVNDCSTDSSEQVCVQLFEKYPHILKFYSLAKNVGEHNAVMAGLNQSSGDWAIVMDDDFQNPVSEVVKLATFSLDNSYDVVYTHYLKKKHGFLRNLGSTFNDKVATIMLKKPKNLYLSSFKAMNRFLVNEIIKYTLPFSYIDGLVLRTTSNIGKLQVEHCPRKQGKSGYSLKKLVSLWINTFTNFSIIPLRISTAMGFISAAIGFFFAIEMIIERILNPALPVGYALLVVLVTIFAGTQLIAIGMVGEYLGRMFLYQNKKPQFSIRKSYHNSSAVQDNGKK